jgi:hypothetical protein
VLVIHLRVRGGLEKREGNDRERVSAKPGSAASAERIDHLKATFMPATKARGNPA